METKRIPYLYIAGASYSGSTLLAMLINSHPQMASISEVGGPSPGTDIRRYRCSCGAPLIDCPFYRKLAELIRSKGSDFSLGEWNTLFRMSRHRIIDIPFVRPLRNVLLESIRDRIVPLIPPYRRVMRDIAVRNRHFAESVLELTGKTLFADAQKDSIRIKFLSEIEQLDLKVIHLVRDARGGAASFMKHKDRHDAAWAAHLWAKANRNADRARRHVPTDRWLLLRYDDICEDYQACMDRICDFAGVDRAVIPPDFFEMDHHIVGNEMRMKQTQRITPDLSWKELLSKEDLSAIARVAGKTNRYFGFSWP